MQFYNVHTHTFTMENAPAHFLRLFMPAAAASVVDKITNTKPGSASVEWLLKHLGGNFGKKYASFLSIGKSATQFDVFQHLINQYDDKQMKFVALTMFMEQCGVGPTTSGFAGQLEQLIEVKKRFPDQLLIFMGVDPRWLSGTELKQKIQSYFETQIGIGHGRKIYPFSGLKLYPSTGFYVFDERLKETFEWAEENEVPVLSHCNYLGGIYNNDAQYIKANLNAWDPYAGTYYSGPSYPDKFNFGRWMLGTNASNLNKLTCSYFLEPYSYQTLLKNFPRLKLCLAHYGGEEHIKLNEEGKPAKGIVSVDKRDWCTQIREMMVKFPNLYTDISYCLYNNDLHSTLLADMYQSGYSERFLFGTDYYMTEKDKPEKKIYEDFKAKATKMPLANGNNAWDQIAGINTASFLKSKYL